MASIENSIKTSGKVSLVKVPSPAKNADQDNSPDSPSSASSEESFDKSPSAGPGSSQGETSPDSFGSSQDETSPDDANASSDKKSEKRKKGVSLTKTPPKVLAQIRFYKRLATAFAGVIVALLAFIIIDRMRESEPEIWSREGSQQIQLAPSPEAAPSPPQAAPEAPEASGSVEGAADGQSPQEAPQPGSEDFSRGQSGSDLPESGPPLSGEAGDAGLLAESLEAELKRFLTEPFSLDPPTELKWTLTKPFSVSPPSDLKWTLIKPFSFSPPSDLKWTLTRPFSFDSLSSNADLEPQTSLRDDPDAGRLWLGLMRLSELPPSAGEGPDTFMPDLAPNQRRRIEPFSEEAESAYPGLSEVWEAILEARRGEAAGRGKMDSKGAAPSLEWTLAELSRLDPDSRAAQKLQPRIMLKVGLAVEEGQEVRKNLPLSARWYALASSLEDVKGQFKLAYAYDHGLGVPVDKSEAMRLYALAAQAGYADAMAHLCFSYHNGDGVAKNEARAFDWCQAAAERGMAEAQLFVGDAYYNGWGVAPDLVESVDWYLQAAQNGNAKAWLALGYAYDRGEGARAHLPSAFNCYLHAAEAGLPQAQFFLAEAFYKGRGVDRDVQKALEWYAKAAAGGDRNAQNRLKSIGRP